MRLEAQDLPVDLWDNKVLNLDVNQIGLKGSPTAVRKIFSPEREQGEIIGDGAGDRRHGEGPGGKAGPERAAGPVGHGSIHFIKR